MHLSNKQTTHPPRVHAHVKEGVLGISTCLSNEVRMSMRTAAEGDVGTPSWESLVTGDHSPQEPPSAIELGLRDDDLGFIRGHELAKAHHRAIRRGISTPITRLTVPDKPGRRPHWIGRLCRAQRTRYGSFGS
jgi:hypothetical protein